MAYRIKKGDKVVVIAGANKSQEGEVLKVNRETGRVIVSGVNVVKRHQKPSQTNPQGGIVEQEAPIHVSNVMLLDGETQKATRVRFEEREGKKVRVAVSSGTLLDS
jgi:large subunit ribosomal protein L24